MAGHLSRGPSADTAVPGEPLNLGSIIGRAAAAAADTREGGAPRQADSPSQVALIDIGSGGAPREYTYDEIDRLADGVARRLASMGHAPGSSIAILAANSVPYVAATLGIMRAGLVAVPVNFKFPAELIHYVLQDSGAQLVFHDAARRDAIPAGLQAVSLEPQAFERFVDPGDFEPVVPAPRATAMMLYTSGSTGRPKGVLLSHQSQLWVVHVRRTATPLRGERALIAAPLYHMNAMALVLLSLAEHATTVLLPQFTARAYLQAIERYRCTWLTAVPPMIAMMLQEGELLRQTDLSSVRALRMGSAPVSASLMAQIRRILPQARVINAYGTTEGGPVVFGPHPQGLPTPEMSVGYPHPQVSVRLQRGPEDGPDQGVLEMKSPGLMTGYHNRPAGGQPGSDTAAPALAAPFTHDGYYISGDVFQRDANGFYTFIGRRDDMFVSGGENIYPAEVERMLERHPAVQQACVVPVDDEIKGTKPVAYVVLRAGAQADEATLKAWSLQHAPAYQHPRRVWFIDALPLASTNKIDRGALKRDAAARVQGIPEV
jgi:acyl-CoA synthetase (AMP-forming)/AMP-acid ligase II